MEQFRPNFENAPSTVEITESDFSPEKISQYHQTIKNKYTDFFSEQLYQTVEPVDIASGIDSTTVFIGSTISIFKASFEEGNIPANGQIVVQPCLRTQNKKLLYTDEALKYNSYFSIIGGIAPIEKTEDVCRTVVDFFQSALHVPLKRILIKISETDQDLVRGMNQISELQIEYNTANPEYYQWKYGMSDVVGRGLTIAIKNEKTSNFEDIGNIIIMDENLTPKAVQWGFGIETLCSRTLNKENPIECALISSIVEYKSGSSAKFSDALAAAVEMYISGVRPDNKGAGSQLRDYLKGLSYLRRKNSYSKEDLLGFVKSYLELRKIQEYEGITREIMHYLNEHEKKIDAFKLVIADLRLDKDDSEVVALLEDPKIKAEWSQRYGIHGLEMAELLRS